MIWVGQNFRAPTCCDGEGEKDYREGAKDAKKIRKNSIYFACFAPSRLIFCGGCLAEYREEGDVDR
jgi:hypothetical protein